MSGRKPINVLLTVSWYYPAMNKGVIRFAQEHGWRLAVDADELVPPHWHGDGVITLLGASQDRLYEQIRKLRVPIVDLTESRPRLRVARVSVDNQQIGRLAAQHFLDRGFRNFMFVHRWELGVSHRRRDAFMEQVHAAGGRCDVISWQGELDEKENTPQKRHSRLLSYLRKAPKPLAVFGTRDGEAIEVLEACSAAGIDVPQQVAVLGVDNSDFCECLNVPLSSIDASQEQVGYQGAALLNRLIQGEEPPALPVYVAPSGIIHRRSTDSLAVDHPAVETALRFLHEHMSEPIQMTDVVKHVRMSRSGLEKAFREHFIRPPMQELRRIRFERALKLLTTTREKVAAIARTCGFRTPHHLCRIFQNELGISPREYRAKFSNH